MKNTRLILRKLLHPPKAIIYLLSPVVFAALIFIFATGKKESRTAYPVYLMSSYSLVVLICDAPKTLKKLIARIKNSRSVQKASSAELWGRSLSDPCFRAELSLYQGTAMNFLYALFRTVTGICYNSVWFISMAVYYFVLGGMRCFLIRCRHRRDKSGLSYEYGCYGRVAVLLFLLNIPMGGMIVLMVLTDSGMNYPGYVIYLSAIYTFYITIASVMNVAKYRRAGSPVLSVAKILNFVSAMMSVLGLQTAMISRFSTNAEEYGRLMNALTGGFVYGIVIIIAVYMAVNAAIYKRKEK